MIASQPNTVEQTIPLVKISDDLRGVQAQKLRKRLRCTDATAHELAMLIFGEAPQ